MLRISIVEGPRRRRLIVEGKLIAPWAEELRRAYETSIADLHGRELIVDLKRVTASSPDGDNVLLQLINEKVKFECGVFMNEVLRQLCKRDTKAKRGEKNVPNADP